MGLFVTKYKELSDNVLSFDILYSLLVPLTTPALHFLAF